MNNKYLLNLIDITVSFEGFLALNKLNLNLKKGELRAVIGPNGAGKTTFLDVITGKVKPTKGEVIFKGESLVGRKEHKIARLGVGRKFQSPRIFENLTVKENLEISVTTPKSPLNLINKSIKDEQLNEIDRLEYNWVVSCKPYSWFIISDSYKDISKSSFNYPLCKKPCCYY